MPLVNPVQLKGHLKLKNNLGFDIKLLEIAQQLSDGV